MRKILCLLISLWSLKVMEAGTITGKISCRDRSDCGNAIVYADSATKEKFAPPKDPLVVDQTHLTFTPHVLPVLVGTTVLFPNNDEVAHNVFSYSPTKLFNVGIYPRGASRQVTFDKPGEVALHCNIHPGMLAYLLVLEQPHFTVTQRDGSYSLRDLPPGKYTLTIWHERYKSVLQTLEVKGTESISLNLDLVERR